MGFSESYNERQRQKSNRKAKKFVKEQGCVITMLIGLSVVIGLSIGVAKLVYYLI